MREALLAVLIALSLASCGAVALVPWERLFAFGMYACALGFVVGVPPAVVYHVQLYRALKPRDELPKGWIWDPIGTHHFLRPTERLGVLSWAIAGGVGVGIIGVGIAALVLSMVAGWQATS